MERTTAFLFLILCATAGSVAGIGTPTLQGLLFTAQVCGRNPIPLVNGQPPDALKDIWATLTPVQQATLAALPQLPAPNSLVDFSYAANKREVKSPLGTKYTYYRFDNPASTDPPLVLVNGLGMSTAGWPANVLAALRAQYTVIIFDNAGIGSTVPLGGALALLPASIPSMATDTLLFINALGLRKVNILGVSMGGMIVTAALAIPDLPLKLINLRYKNPINKAIIVSGAPGLTPSPPNTGFFPDPLLVAKVTAGQATDIDWLSALYDLQTPLGVAAACSSIIQGAGGLVEPTAPENNPTPPLPSTLQKQFLAITNWWNSTTPFNPLLPLLSTGGLTETQLGNIRDSVLVIGGSGDFVVPAKNQERIANLVPGATLKIYDGARHGVLLERFNDILPRILAFLG